MPRKSDGSNILRRGSACLSCRRRKLRCDGARPTCQQCTTMRRAEECTYDDSSRKSRTQSLREKLFALEAKVRELEHGSSMSSLSQAASSSLLPNDSSSTQTCNRSSHQQSSASWTTDPSVKHTQFSDPSQSHSSWLSPVETPNESTASGSTFSSSEMNMPSMIPCIDSSSQLPAMISPPYTDSSGTPGPSDRQSLNEPRVMLTAEMHNHLIQAFIDHHKQCCFYTNTSRFDLSSSATIYQNTPINLALMSAILLMGCFFSRVDDRLETQLLEQTQHEMSRTLHNEEQLMDLVQTLCLLAQYFFFNHRSMEGTMHLNSAKRISRDFCLHNISPSSFPFDLEFPLDSSSYTWQEKSSIFWQIFMVDKFWATTNDHCETLPNVERSACRMNISTPLPVLDGVDLDVVLGNSTVEDIFEGDNFRGVYLSVTAFKAIASAIFDRSLRVNNSSMMARDNATWIYHRMTEVALVRFTSIVHPFTWYDPRFPTKTRIDTDLYAVHSLIFASTIHLHLDNVMNLKVNHAANKMVELINHLREDDYPYLDPVLSICWSSIIVIFRRMIANGTARVVMNSESAVTVSYSIALLRHCVDVLFNALRHLSKTMPLANNLLTGLDSFSQEPFYPGLMKTIPTFS